MSPPNPPEPWDFVVDFDWFEAAELIREQELLEEAAADWAADVGTIDQHIDELERLVVRLSPWLTAYPQGRDRLPERELLRRLGFLKGLDLVGLPAEILQRMFALAESVDGLQERAAAAEFAFWLRRLRNELADHLALAARREASCVVEESGRVADSTRDYRPPRLLDPARVPVGALSPPSSAVLGVKAATV
ncbi:MAG: hypothetical protein WD965_06635 [Actinomycetota bacterium]